MKYMPSQCNFFLSNHGMTLLAVLGHKNWLIVFQPLKPYNGY